MTILKGIPKVISPRLLFALARMGHGDEIVLADANFPSASCAKTTTFGEEIRCDGTGIPELLSAILTLMPLDPAVPAPAFTMEMMPMHVAAGWKAPIKDEYKKILNEAAGGGGGVSVAEVERFAFYDQAKKAFAIVSTGEGALYANLILKKGVIGDK
jgi:L-fucose mutarotase